MTFISHTDVFYEIAKGNRPGENIINRIGQNNDVDTGTTPETIWNSNGSYIWQTSVQNINIVSSDTEDNPAGSGADKVKLIGIDVNREPLEEEINLNGTSTVSTTAQFLTVPRAVNTSDNDAVGTISATFNVSGDVAWVIDPGNNESLNGFDTVPAGKTMFIFGYVVSFLRSGGVASSADICLFIRPFGEVFQLKFILGLTSAGTSTYGTQLKIPLVIPEKSDVDWRVGDVSANNSAVSVNFDYVLATNP